MGGLVDAAHWLALAVVLVAMLRTAEGWRIFLNVNLVVGLVIAIVAVARFHFPQSSRLGWWPEPNFPRIGDTLGNPIFLGAHMQTVALTALGFLAHAEIATRTGPPAASAPGPAAALRRAPAAATKVLGCLWIRAMLAAAAVALCVVSLTAGHAIHSGAAALHRAENPGPFMAELRRSIRAFGPLATMPRIILIEDIAPNWRVILAQDPAKAFRLLAWAEEEAQHALADEPDNWQLQHGLAKMFAAVAATHPEYPERARYYYDRARAVAPYRNPLMPGKSPSRRSDEP